MTSFRNFIPSCINAVWCYVYFAQYNETKFHYLTMGSAILFIRISFINRQKYFCIAY